MKPSLLPCSIAILFALASGAAQAAVIPSGRSVVPSGFEENKGQVLTTAGDAAPFVRYRLTQGNTSIFLLGNGIAYQFNRLHYPAGYEALEKDAHLDPTKQQELDSLRKSVRLETFRMDVLLEGANAGARTTTEGRSDDYTQYYNHNALDVHTYNRVTYHSAIAYGGHQNTLGGAVDAFLVKFNPSGSRQWGTYYGGPSHDYSFSCATYGSDDVYLAGITGSDTAIASNGYQNTYGGGGYHGGDAFLAKFNSIGVRQWATYYGGATNEYGESCAADGSGNVYLAGLTYSDTSIASGGHQNTYGGGGDGFLVKFDGGVDITTGITPIQDHQQNFSIWPNPNTSDRFFLQPQGTGPAEVQLFDALGQLQRTWHLQLVPGQAPLELKLGSGLAKGMYIVHYTVDGRASTAPLVVQ
jgi:hypothetical protein